MRVIRGDAKRGLPANVVVVLLMMLISFTNGLSHICDKFIILLVSHQSDLSPLDNYPNSCSAGEVGADQTESEKKILCRDSSIWRGRWIIVMEELL